MSQGNVAQTRSSTGHILLPAFNSNDDPVLVPLVTSRNLVSWTFGRGTVVCLRQNIFYISVQLTYLNADLANMACGVPAHRVCG